MHLWFETDWVNVGEEIWGSNYNEIEYPNCEAYRLAMLI